MNQNEVDQITNIIANIEENKRIISERLTAPIALLDPPYVKSHQFALALHFDNFVPGGSSP